VDGELESSADSPDLRLVVGPDTRASFVTEAVAKLPATAADGLSQLPR
jgi:hypothetical protein